MATNSIALVAKRHSGKTTFANMLIDEGFTKVAFADPVKDTWVAMYNLFLDRVGFEPDFDRARLETNKELHRMDLERLGTVHGRRLDDQLWVKMLEQLIDQKRSQAAEAGQVISLVTDDARFLNEVEALRRKGFTIVKIVRDEDERKQSVWRSLYRSELVRRGVPPEQYGVLDFEVTKWADEELERTMLLPSEVEVDLIEADISLANTSLEALALAAKRISNNPELVGHSVSAFA